MNNILVDIDPARDNGPALARAISLARDKGAAIELVASAWSHWLDGMAGINESAVGASRDEYLHELRQWLAALAEPLLAEGLRVGTAAVWHYSRHEAVLDRAGEIGADLIVRMAGGRSRLERLFLSSTDWELIRHSREPLWLTGSGDLPQRSRLLVAVDPGHADEDKERFDRVLLDSAKSLAAALGAELHLFSAFEPPTAMMPMPIAGGAGAAAAPMPRIDEDLVSDVRSAHRARLESLADDAGIGHERAHLGEGLAADEVADAVERLGIDIVVAGAVSRNWLQRWLVGSTTEAIFDAVDCDLYVVKLEDDE